MKTAETIEASEARKEQQAEGTPEKIKRGPYKQRREGTDPNRFVDGSRGPYKQPNTSPHLKPFHWQKGQSGNPSGKPKQDVAHQIARAVFENNAEQLYEQFAKALLKGNAYAFTQLADRAYGKIADKLEFSPGAEYKDLTTEALVERVKFLERKLGVTISADDSRGTGVDPVRNLPPYKPPED